MHTAVEVTCVKDVLRTARLVTAFTTDLNDQTMDKLSFEVKEENKEEKDE